MFLEKLRLRPDYSVAHYNLGNLLERLGRRDEARAAFRRALELDPGFLRARAQLQRLGRGVGETPRGTGAPAQGGR